MVGVVVAVWWGQRRWEAAGGRRGLIADVAVWAVPAGLVGARLYHVITDPELYFIHGANPWNAFAVWQGGLGIWGGVIGGALGAAYACRRYGVNVGDLAGVLAPVLPVAQAIGRFGNWFNQELYGRPSGLPWALRIDPANRPSATPTVSLYQPTFAYEALWNLGVAGLVVWAQRRYRLSGWRSFALYVAAYTAGRGWIEALRVDHANRLLGLRLNDWTSLIVFVGAVTYLIWGNRRSHIQADDPSDPGISATAAGTPIPHSRCRHPPL